MSVDIKQYSPLTLAFLGDAVYELYIREILVKKANTSAGKLHNEKIKYVCCEKQAEICEKILPLLTEDELAIYKRGRNAGGGGHSPKHANSTDYHKATGLEALIGYLYLLDKKDRILELFSSVDVV
ncbi:MAG: ribonuclease III [Oscillospiraceae bacterium]|jgi:ribonuclease-3 family protein|nr:ribonuclease III [Oscillospiraceae bacterium]